jgi:flagellar motility protein MotE (MotC chaperone)
MKEIRLLPLVIIAVGALFALKGIGLIFGESYLIGGGGPAMAQDAAAQDAGAQDAAAQDAGAQDSMAKEEPAGGDSGDQENAAAGDMAPDMEGGQDAADGAEAMDAAGDGQQDGGKPKQNTDMTAAEAKEDEPSFLQRVLGGRSRSRDAVLESLAERRKELEARDKEIDLRENLLKAAEQRVEKRIAELKELEARLAVANDVRSEEDDERLKNVVTMYESMKAKDAARIFNRLDMSVVVDVASKMSARQMALVLAEMESEVAQRLTLELSAKPAQPVADASGGGDLPKIMGTRPAN